MFSDVVAEMVALSDQGLDEQLRALEVQRRQLDAQMAAAVAVADARQLYTADGHRSMKGYLRATCNWSNADVARFRALARTVDRIDGVGDVWLNGHVGTAQVNELAKAHANPRVREQLAPFVPELLEHAEHLSYDDYKVCVARVVAAVDADGAHRDVDANVESRSVTVKNAGGTLFLNAAGGDALVNEEVQMIFDRFCEAEFRIDTAARAEQHGTDADAHPLQRTARQRRYDALVKIFRIANDNPDANATPLEPVVNVIIDQASFARMLAIANLADETLDTGDEVPISDRRNETGSGAQLHDHQALRAVLTGHIRRVVVNGQGTIIDFGRRQRCFTGSARTAAKLLVRHCEHPGCDLPSNICQVDHREEWHEHGHTDQNNADIRCGKHNRHKHREKLHTRRTRRGHRFTIRADGSLILPAGARAPDLDNEPDPKLGTLFQPDSEQGPGADDGLVIIRTTLDELVA